MFEVKGFAGCREGEGFVARPIVSHHAGRRDPEALLIGDRRMEAGDGAGGLFVGVDAGHRDARCVVDGDMDILPAHPAPIALARPASSDPVPNPFETPKFLDVQMDQPARLLVALAPDWFGGFEVLQPRQTGAAQNPADGGGRNPVGNGGEKVDHGSVEMTLLRAAE